jgi:hypothetical protein
MNAPRIVPICLLLSSAIFTGCRQAPKPTTSGRVETAVAPKTVAEIQPSTTRLDSPSVPGAPTQAATPSVPVAPTEIPVPSTTGTQKLEAIEIRQGPFSIASQTFTVVFHNQRIPGSTGDSAETLALIEIVDAAGNVAYREEFPHTPENGEFPETCSAGVTFLKGSNGSGLLLDEGCLPSAPLSGGPWRVIGLVNGKLTSLGKPMYAQGEMGDFVPGKINHMGTLTQILPDELRIRLFTGYFFVSVPVRVNWLQGKLELAQHCFYQTGHGFAEGGCEIPVDGVELHSSGEEMTFVRMFTESNEQLGPPAHVVVKQNSKVEVLLAKVFVRMDEQRDSTGLDVGDDIWVQVRIDGKFGWIHTNEDFQAIGLYQSG